MLPPPIQTEQGVQNIRSSAQTLWPEQLWAPPGPRASLNTAPPAPGRPSQAGALRGCRPRRPSSSRSPPGEPAAPRGRGPAGGHPGQNAQTRGRPPDSPAPRRAVGLRVRIPLIGLHPPTTPGRQGSSTGTAHEPQLPQCGGETTRPEMHRIARRRSGPGLLSKARRSASRRSEALWAGRWVTAKGSLVAIGLGGHGCPEFT